MLGSGWRTLDIIATLEQDLGVPVVHPVTARAWEIQKRLRVRKPVKGYGRLLRDLAVRKMPMTCRRTRARRSLFGAAAAATPPAAQTAEQFYKGRAVTLIVGFAPGGINDISARVVGKHSAASSPAIRPSWCRTCPAPAASAPPTGSTTSPRRTAR